MIAEDMAAQKLSSVIADLEAQLCADPQLPHANPTESFWQLPPHQTLSEVQSKALPAITDIAIIGSGVTGCSVAKNLLDLSTSSSPSQHFSITVFEARKLTSGATGRNGGLLSNFVPGDYETLSTQFGHEQAVKIAKYANRTLDKMHELASSSEETKKLSEVRNLLDVIGFEDEESFRAAVQSWQLYEEHVPEDRGKARILSAQEVESEYNMRAAAGAIVYPNGAFWPYRLITHLWEQLYTQYQSRLSIETHTPVTEITYDASTNQTHPYILSTPRGPIRASKVVHATNGHTGHLLPQLRGKIYPLRGTMSTQKSTSSFGHHGHDLSWSMVNSGRFDPDTGILEAGLYYSNQNPHTHDIFIGGEKAYLNELFVSDDSTAGAPCVQNISTILPRFFPKGWAAGEAPEVKKIWSGILGFTADRLPIIGKLPSSVTTRGEEGGDEYIAAGFNGYGMPLCWSAGEAVAKMVLGVDVSDFLPEAFLPREERLWEKMDPAKALEALLGVESILDASIDRLA